nr:CPBP family intramembrane metalloprotease [Paenibacillus turpanensis]
MNYPILFPLMAWVAAIEEEAVYRLFGIALFTKLLRFRPLAVLLSSVIWALGHVQYPIYPSYTRLIEVTVLGILFGYLFLKFGFITVVFAHAAMDSILMGLSVMSLGDTVSALSGLFYLVFPAIVGWLLAAYYKKKRPPSAAPVPLE